MPVECKTKTDQLSNEQKQPSKVITVIKTKAIYFLTFKEAEVVGTAANWERRFGPETPFQLRFWESDFKKYPQITEPLEKGLQ